MATRYYNQQRFELLDYVPAKIHTALEVGCGSGAFGKLLKDHKKIQVSGIEPVYDAVKEAQTNLFDIFHGTFEQFLVESKSGSKHAHFDLLVFNDVLEHFSDPWDQLRACHDLFGPNGGYVLASIPNMRYYKIIKQLLFEKDWRYVEKGILDFTHLRFFTRESMCRMFTDCGYEVERIGGLNRTPKLVPRLINRISMGSLEDMLYTQYVIVARYHV